jgi:hypothetical protein
MKSFREFIKENHTGAVSGLGHTTGTPAVNPLGIANYVAQNTADSDNKNNILGMRGGSEHMTDHNKVGFKSFSPNDLRSGRKHKKKENI